MQRLARQPLGAGHAVWVNASVWFMSWSICKSLRNVEHGPGLVGMQMPTDGFTSTAGQPILQLDCLKNCKRQSIDLNLVFVVLRAYFTRRNE